ncbi:hypothetical protein [Dyella japonica]|uniref:Toxin co-regulated pilus biosynthesis protein Q C-terminal domain-containing protein n=1 Tax=Dyella japonica TaxID=231455 RepID=A0ABV2JW90_9GAMM
MKNVIGTAVSVVCSRGDRKRGFGATKTLVIASTVLLLAGCATPPAKDYSGKWKPVNRYQQAPTAIPLNGEYVYYATPMDGTLRTMLRRWAKDSGMQFSYQLQADYTLSQPIASIRTTDVHRALAEVNTVYGPQGVQVYARGNEITAKPASASKVSPNPVAAPPMETGAGTKEQNTK